MATNRGGGRQDFFSNKLNIYCNSIETNNIYFKLNSNHDNNLNKYLLNIAKISSQSNSIINNCFSQGTKVKINQDEIKSLQSIQNQLINNQTNLWQTVAGSYLLANLSEDNFASVCLTGNIGAITESNKTSVANSINFISMQAIMSELNQGRFSVSLSYNGITSELNFTKIISDFNSGDTFAILLASDIKNIKSNSDIDTNSNQVNPDDGAVLLQIIAGYALVVGNPITVNVDSTADIQALAQNYFSIFANNFTQTINIFKTQDYKKTSADTKRGNSEIVSATTNEKPITEVGVPDGSIVIVPDTAPLENTNIVLNTFTQPAFETSLSILDIIRSEKNNAIAQDQTPIVYNSTQDNLGSTVNSSNSNCLQTALSVMAPKDKLAIIAVLQEKIKSYQKELDILTTQKNKLDKKPESLFASIAGGIKSAAAGAYSAGRTLVNSEIDSIEKQSELLAKDITEKADSVGKIAKTGWNELKSVPTKLWDSVNISKPSLASIDMDSVRTKVFDSLKDKFGTLPTCNAFVNLLNTATQANQKDAVSQVQNISKDAAQKSALLGADMQTKQNHIAQIKEQLSKLT